jgi:translation initiation factor 2 beta subunit (eIF-2beta)/eIF-5
MEYPLEIGVMTMLMEEYQKTHKACSECGGQPTIKTAFGGDAYFVECSVCGWSNGMRRVEMTPLAALSHWNKEDTP